MSKGGTTTQFTGAGSPGYTGVPGGDFGGLTGSALYGSPTAIQASPHPSPVTTGADTRQWSWEQTAQLASPMIAAALELRKQKEAEKRAKEEAEDAERRAAMGMVGRIGGVMSSRGGDGGGFDFLTRGRGSFGR